jgi:hypothetical protein
MAALSAAERAALLRCRSAGRFDRLGEDYDAKPTPEERAEEEAATLVRLPRNVWARLVADRLVVYGDCRYRITDAGRAALRVGEGSDG